MTNISNRDKKLIIVLLILIVCYGIFSFVYKPMMNSIAENSVLLATEQEQQTNMINALSRYGVQDETINELNDNINERLNAVSKYQENEEIENYLVSLSSTLDIKYTSINFSDYEVAEMNAILDESLVGTTDVEDTTESDTPANYNLELYACTITDCTESAYISETVPLVTLEKKNVAVNFEGTVEDYKKFLDKINEDNKTMLITQSSEAINAEGADSFTIVMDIYSIKGW